MSLDKYNFFHWRAMRLDSQLVFHLTLLLAKILEATSAIVSKEVLNSNGIPVLLVQLYTGLCGSFSLLLAAYLIERNKLPLRKRKVQLTVLVTGLLNFVSHVTAVYALNLTSPQLLSVIFCTVPTLASLIAILFRVENVQLNRYDGQVKVLSIVIACCGAAVMAMYQGSKLLGTEISISQWQLGSLLAALSSVMVAVSVNIQIPVLKAYHAPWSLIAAISVTSTALSTLAYACLVLVEGWSFPSPLVFLGLVYSGAVGGGLSFGLISWVLSKGGPLLVYCYISVTPILTTILSMTLLGTSLYLGSVLGTSLVICGVILCGWSEYETRKLAALANLHEPLAVLA